MDEQPATAGTLRVSFHRLSQTEQRAHATAAERIQHLSGVAA
ncbi:hypothetical protein [Microbispora bryophytorum]